MINNLFTAAKIDIVKSKFATSILSEAIDKLILLHCNEDHVTNDTPNSKNINFEKYAIDVNNIKHSFRQVISQLEVDNSFTDFSGKSVAEKESKFLDEYNRNKTMLQKKCSLLQVLKERISSHRNPTETLDVNNEIIFIEKLLMYRK